LFAANRDNLQACIKPVPRLCSCILPSSAPMLLHESNIRATRWRPRTGPNAIISDAFDLCHVYRQPNGGNDEWWWLGKAQRARRTFAGHTSRVPHGHYSREIKKTIYFQKHGTACFEISVGVLVLLQRVLGTRGFWRFCEISVVKSTLL